MRARKTQPVGCVVLSVVPPSALSPPRIRRHMAGACAPIVRQFGKLPSGRAAVLEPVEQGAARPRQNARLKLRKEWCVVDETGQKKTPNRRGRSVHVAPGFARSERSLIVLHTPGPIDHSRINTASVHSSRGCLQGAPPSSSRNGCGGGVKDSARSSSFRPLIAFVHKKFGPGMQRGRVIKFQEQRDEAVLSWKIPDIIVFPAGPGRPVGGTGCGAFCWGSCRARGFPFYKE